VNPSAPERRAPEAALSPSSLVGCTVYYRLPKGVSKGKVRAATVSRVIDAQTMDLHVLLRGERDKGMGAANNAPMVFVEAAKIGTAEGTWAWSVTEKDFA